MPTLHRLRLYHAVLAVLAVLAFMSGEAGLVHAYLGYSVAAVIALRLVWALSGDRVLGITLFFPSLQGISSKNFIRHPAISRILLLGVVLSLIAATGTGIVMDQGRSLKRLQTATLSTPAYADDDGDEDRESSEHEESALGKAHEALSNLFIAFVMAHVAYLLVFKFPLVRFMLFIPAKSKDTV